MDEVVRIVSGGLDLDEVARGLWESALPHLAAALEGEDAEFLAAVEEVARDAGLNATVSLAALLDAFNDGRRQLSRGLEQAGAPEAAAAGRRLRGLENVALTRIATGYCSALEETIVLLRSSVEEASPVDRATGAMKPVEIADQLSLEVDRCQRMDLSLGLIEMAVRGASEDAHVPGRAAGPSDLQRVGECLRDSVRGYDSIGMTAHGDFLVVLPDISRRGLAGAADRLRRELATCAGGELPEQMVFALAHYDYVDVNPREMLDALDHGLREAMTVGQELSWS